MGPLPIALIVTCLLTARDRAQLPPTSPPEKASAATRADWANRLRSATAVDVRHTEARRRGAMFTTVHPCEYQFVIEHARETLPPDSALVALFAGLLEQRADTSQWIDDCPTPPELQDEVTLAFIGTADTVRARFQPRTQSVIVSDAGRSVASFRAPPLSAELERLLPDDLRLPGIEPCPSHLATEADRHRADQEELPEPTKRVPPDYPDRSRARGEEGFVIVTALVDTTGNIERTVVVTSDPSFDESAVQAVEQWRFKPARVNGRPVAVWVAVPVKFSMH